MILSWGKPSSFQHTTSTDGAPGASATWVDIPIPKENTMVLNTTEGAETLAIQEGGEIIDVRYAKNTSELEWDEFVKKGETPTFDDNEGIVAGEHAFRWLPEDNTCKGMQIDRAVVRVIQSYSVADGIIRKYKAKVLKPASGKSVKEYTASSTPASTD